MKTVAIAAAAVALTLTSAAFAGNEWSATRAIEARRTAMERANAPYGLTGESKRVVRSQDDRAEVRHSPSYSTGLFNFSRASR